MFDHVSICVVSIARSEAFYDAIMAALGHPKVGATDTWLGYGLRADGAHPARTYLSVLEDAGGSASGKRHWAFRVRNRGAVEAFWQAGRDAGGKDDGAPGLRPHYHDSYYAAFLLDPDGNRIETVCHAEAI